MILHLPHLGEVDIHLHVTVVPTTRVTPVILTTHLLTVAVVVRGIKSVS